MGLLSPFYQLLSLSNEPVKSDHWTPHLLRYDVILLSMGIKGTLLSDCTGSQLLFVSGPTETGHPVLDVNQEHNLPVKTSMYVMFYFSFIFTF